MEPEVLAAAVAECAKARAHQRGAWDLVERSARKYQMMKQHGKYLERGSVISVSRTDQESYTKFFLDDLLREIESAFLEDTLMGQTLAANT